MAHAVARHEEARVVHALCCDDLALKLERSREEQARCDLEREKLSAAYAQLRREFADVAPREFTRDSSSQSSTAPSSGGGGKVEVRHGKGLGDLWQHVRPTTSRDIRVIRTLEAKLVGDLAFPVKPIYDMAKRTLGPLDMILPTAIFEKGCRSVTGR